MLKKKMEGHKGKVGEIEWTMTAMRRLTIKKLMQMLMAMTTITQRCLTNSNILTVNEFSLICHIISGGIDGQ